MIVPMYNEAESIEVGVGLYLQEIQELRLSFEIILVDDGSQDDTGVRADKLAKKHSHIHVIHHKTNLGVGKAMLSGIKKATGEWVFVDPIDRPFHLSDIKSLLPVLPSCDILVLARTDRRANSIVRKLTSIVNYLLIRLLFGLPLKDFQFIQFYRRNLVSYIPVMSTDTFVPPELLIRLHKKGARIKEVRGVFHPRRAGSSKYSSINRYIRTVREMLAFWYATYILQSVA